MTAFVADQMSRSSDDGFGSVTNSGMGHNDPVLFFHPAMKT